MNPCPLTIEQHDITRILFSMKLKQSVLYRNGRVATSHIVNCFLRSNLPRLVVLIPFTWFSAARSPPSRTINDLRGSPAPTKATN